MQNFRLPMNLCTYSTHYRLRINRLINWRARRRTWPWSILAINIWRNSSSNIWTRNQRDLEKAWTRSNWTWPAQMNRFTGRRMAFCWRVPTRKDLAFSSRVWWTCSRTCLTTTSQQTLRFLLNKLDVYLDWENFFDDAFNEISLENQFFQLYLF